MQTLKITKDMIDESGLYIGLVNVENYDKNIEIDINLGLVKYYSFIRFKHQSGWKHLTDKMAEFIE